MKKLLPILLFAGFSSPAFADITHKLSSSVQLTAVSYTHLTLPTRS